MIAHKVFTGTFHSVLKISMAKDNPNTKQSHIFKIKKKKCTISQLSPPRWNGVEDLETESTQNQLTTAFRHFIYFLLHYQLFSHLFPNSLSLNPPKVTGSFNQQRNRNGDSRVWIIARKSKAGAIC